MQKRKNEERSLQITSKSYFDWALPDVLAFHCSNESYFGENRESAIIQMALLKKQGFLPGVPDWLLFWHCPMYGLRFAAIELKIGRNDLSESQIKFRDRWIKVGGIYAVCRSMDEIETTIKDWGLKPKYKTPLANERSGRQMQQMAMIDAFMPLEPRLPRLRPEDVKI